MGAVTGVRISHVADAMGAHLGHAWRWAVRLRIAGATGSGNRIGLTDVQVRGLMVALSVAHKGSACHANARVAEQAGRCAMGNPDAAYVLARPERAVACRTPGEVMAAYDGQVWWVLNVEALIARHTKMLEPNGVLWQGL